MDEDGVCLITFDQCACGLQVHSDGFSEKSTSILTNNPWLAALLSERQCSGDHHHVPLEGGKLTKKAQVYPPELCRIIAQNVFDAVSGKGVPSFFGLTENEHSFPVLPAEGAGDEEEEEANEVPQTSEKEAPQKILSEKQRRLVRRVHVNTGHPNREQFLRMLKAAGPKEEVLKYVKNEFKCDHCNLQLGPAPRRRAQMPKTFAFNKIVALDVLYMSFQDFRVPMLNAVCVGTNLQVAVRLSFFFVFLLHSRTSDKALSVIEV